MTRLGAVDCGTNSIRLLVAEPSGNGLRDLHREMRIVRLGEGVDRTGELSAAALARTAAAISDYAGICQRLGVERLRFVATSATRDARNRAEFTQLVHERLGVQPEVVTGREEAQLSFTGATAGLAGEATPFIVIDVGGGSTEVVRGGRAVTHAVSVDVGCVRLSERHLPDDPPSPAQVAAAEEDVRAAVDRVRAEVPLAGAGTVIGVAGTATTLAGLALGLGGYDPERIHGSRLSSADLVQWTERLLAASRAERAALPVMHPGRADVIAAGALILRELLAATGADSLVVSEADILDGIALSIAG